MAKRFTGTDKWDKAWFRKLSPRHKALWEYLRDKCDQAGVWEIDFESASHYINDVTDIIEADLRVFGDRIEKFRNNKIWIVDFVEYQCGELSEKCAAHKPIFKLLKKYGLLDRVLNRVYNTLQEKEIEIEGEKEIEKDQDKEKETGPKFSYQPASAPEPITLTVEIPDKNMITQEILSDEIFIEALQMTHKGKDLKQAWEECWIHHTSGQSPPRDVQGWKQKFNGWLSNKKANGSSKTKQQQRTTDLVKGFGEMYGNSPGIK
jgi:hypothetical protein